jgi:hypothetical protein
MQCKKIKRTAYRGSNNIMKVIHFYGCSFTAGDELSDHEYPELANHTTQETYWPARLEFLDHQQQHYEYLEKNKQKAYPAKVAAKDFETINFAQNGASLEEMIYTIIMNLSQVPEVKPDAVFLQIPTMHREAVFFDRHPYIATIRYTNLVPKEMNDSKYHDYMTSRIMAFTDVHFAISDLLKLYSLKCFLDSKNIPFYLIEMMDELQIRYSFIKSNLYNHITDKLKIIPILNIAPIVSTTENSVCLAGHFTEKIHEIISNKIVELLD